MEYALRFMAGGLIVSAFAVIADILRPKGFAGLFSAAPSVALATLTLTLLSDDKIYAATEARSMIAGAAAYFLYAAACTYLIGKKRLKSAPTAVATLAIWAVSAWGIWGLWLR
jgi:uncharacterized membrane protein (GlpM family)